MLVKINDQPMLIHKNTFSIEDVLDERSHCAFTVIDTEGTMVFRKGQNVEVFNDQLIFAGVINTCQSMRIANGPDKEHVLSVIDWHYLADKRIIAKAYEDEYIGDIIRDIVDIKLSEEGVTIDRLEHTTFLSSDFHVEYPYISTVESGPLITEAVFNYIRVSEAIESLAEKANYWWKIDQYKKLFFVTKTAYTAPFIITSNVCNKDSISVINGNNQYRNTQYIKGVRDITDEQIERYSGDDETQSFPVGFPVAKVPTVEISTDGGSWTLQTVGIRQLESGKQWYWSKGSNIISQDESGTPLSGPTDSTVADRLRITYEGEFEIVMKSEIEEEILAQAAIDGTTGIVEDVADLPNTTGRTSAIENANAKLARYAVVGKHLSFRTWKKGIQTGMLLTVDLIDHGLNNEQMLVESVVITYEDNMLWYQIKAVDGPGNQNWTNFFGTLAAKGLSIRENVQEDQVLVTVAEFDKTWEAANNPNIFKQVYAANDLFPSDTLFPTFQEDERVMYFSWFFDGVELGRKAITKQSGNIFSINYLSPLDANGTIDYVGWWGGIEATETLGTGVLVDYQEYNKVKTQLEAIQIEKDDILDFTPDTGDLLITVRFLRDLEDQIAELLERSS